MTFTCIHCSQAFEVSPEQMGTTVGCPHCGGPNPLPASSPPDDLDAARQSAVSQASLLRSAIAGASSMVIHIILLVLLALIQFGGEEGVGEGEAVFIGKLPGEALDDSPRESFDPVAAESDLIEPEAFEPLEIEPPTELLQVGGELAEAAASPTAASGGGSFDLAGSASGGGGGGGWDGMLQNLRRNGLEVVICFDSTGSMGGEINVVKDQVRKITTTLVKLVPKSRISICTYRDNTDLDRGSYLVKGIPLTSDMDQVANFLDRVEANGGGDHPEAVEAGLEWAIKQNSFRGQSRKVILVFGDAPPHPQDRPVCLELASDFARQQDGIVSTITCRSARPMPDFVDIAQAGGGEAFLTTDEKQIMTQIMVLVFGSQYRGKVVEAFKLMER